MPKIEDALNKGQKKFKPKRYRAWDLDGNLEQILNSNNKEPTPNGKQTVSNGPVPNGKQTVSNTPAPNGKQTVSNTPTPNGKQTVSNTPTPNGKQTVSNTPAPNGKQTVSKHRKRQGKSRVIESSIGHIVGLTGIQRIIVDYLTQLTINNEGVTAPVLAKELLAKTECNNSTLKNALTRLYTKKILIKGASKDGKGGYRIFQLSKELLSLKRSM